MNNKTTLFKILMFFGTVFLIYFLLVIFDYFFHLYQYKTYKLSNKIITERKQNEDRKYLKNAKEKGYGPIIYPYLYTKNKDLSEFAKSLKIIPINAQPDSNVYYCNEGYGLIKFKTDRMGFRNNDKIWDKIDNPVKKIVFIGDSFTQGACVNDNLNIPAQFKDFITYNLGLDGNNPVIYSNLTKLFIPKIKPDFVVQLFFVNDFTETGGTLFQKNLKIQDLNKRYFDNDKNFKLSEEILTSINKAQKIINNIQMSLPGERPNIFLRGLRYLSLPTIRTYTKSLKNKFFFKLSPTTKNSIKILKETCIKFNCKPIIGFIPNSQYWEPNPLTQIFREKVKNYTNLQDMTFVDFSSELNAYGNSAYAPKGTHLSPEGYKIVSNKIKSKLFSSN